METPKDLQKFCFGGGIALPHCLPLEVHYSPYHSKQSHFKWLQVHIIENKLIKYLHRSIFYFLGCTVYDVVINDSFLSKIQQNNFFMGFFMTVVYEGIESKYNTTLSRAWVILKNKKCVGDINRHKIRKRNKPIIQEMDQVSEIGLSEG